MSMYEDGLHLELLLEFSLWQKRRFFGSKERRV